MYAHKNSVANLKAYCIHTYCHMISTIKIILWYGVINYITQPNAIIVKGLFVKITLKPYSGL